MSLKKEFEILQKRLDSERIRVRNVLNTEIQECRKQIEHLKHLIQQVKFCNLAPAKEISNLQKQIECGVQGHKFQLFEDPWTMYNQNTKKQLYFGAFRCSICGLRITRKLAPSEIQAIKKLGFFPNTVSE